jgi:isopentenyldiphosphate isomerase
MADELLDIVNDEDIVTGQEMRSVVHRLGLQHRGAHVFLFAPDGKLLVQKRSKDRAQYPSLLDCTVSEHIKAGEGYFEAALRGTKEEMGVEGIELKPLVKFRMEYGPNDNEISMLYEGMVDPEKVTFDPVEIEEIEYYSLAELEKMSERKNTVLCGWFTELTGWYLGKPSIKMNLLWEDPAPRKKN